MEKQPANWPDQSFQPSSAYDFALFELPKTFRVKKWVKILLTVATPFMIALFVWLLLMPVLKPGGPVNKAYWMIALISVTMIVVFVIGIIDTWKSKLVISRDAVEIYDFTGRKEMLLTAMKGYRINDKYLFIEPLDKTNKRIKITRYYEE